MSDGQFTSNLFVTWILIHKKCSAGNPLTIILPKRLVWWRYWWRKNSLLRKQSSLGQTLHEFKVACSLDCTVYTVQDQDKILGPFLPSNFSAVTRYVVFVPIVLGGQKSNNHNSNQHITSKSTCSPTEKWLTYNCGDWSREVNLSPHVVENVERSLEKSWGYRSETRATLRCWLRLRCSIMLEIVIGQVLCFNFVCAFMVRIHEGFGVLFFRERSKTVRWKCKNEWFVWANHFRKVVAKYLDFTATFLGLTETTSLHFAMRLYWAPAETFLRRPY